MPDPEPQKSSFLKIFPTASLPMLMALMDQSMVATAAPSIASDLAAIDRISLIVIVYLIAATIAAPLYGRLGDAFGRRRLLMLAICIYLAGSLISLTAPDMTVLLGARAVQGMGGGGMLVLSHALIAERVAPRERARYQGFFAAIGVTSNAMGPVLGGIVTEYLGWRTIFLLNLPLGLLALLLVFRLPRQARTGTGYQVDFAGLVLFTCFVVSAMVLLNSISGSGEIAFESQLLLAVLALASLALLLVVERRHAMPLLPVELFRDATLWRAYAAAGCFSAVTVSLLTFVPIFYAVVHRMSPASFGVMLVPMTLGAALGSTVIGGIISRTGRTAIWPSLGLMIAAGGLSAIGLFLNDISAMGLSLALGLTSVFIGTTMAVVQVSVQVAARRDKLGAATAAVQYSRFIGSALGTTLVAGLLFGSLGGAGSDATRLFGDILKGGTGQIDGLSPAAMVAARAAVSDGFRAAFLCMASYALIGSILFATIPLRRI